MFWATAASGVVARAAPTSRAGSRRRDERGMMWGVRDDEQGGQAAVPSRERGQHGCERPRAPLWRCRTSRCAVSQRAAAPPERWAALAARHEEHTSHEAAGDGRVVGRDRAAPAPAPSAAEERAPVGRGPRDAERDPVRATLGHPLAHAPDGARLRLGRDVLAPAAGLAAPGRVAATAPAHAGDWTRAALDSRSLAAKKGELPSARTRPPKASRAANTTSSSTARASRSPSR
jgi:hypothetical protein